jgi:hypothetical protein
MRLWFPLRTARAASGPFSFIGAERCPANGGRHDPGAWDEGTSSARGSARRRHVCIRRCQARKVGKASLGPSSVGAEGPSISARNHGAGFAPHMRQLWWSHVRLSGLGRRGARAARGITRRTRPWLITGRGGKRDRPDGRPYRIVRTLPMPRVTRPYSRTRWPRPLSVADRHRDDDAVAGDGVGAEPFSLGQASTRIMKL